MVRLAFLLCLLTAAGHAQSWRARFDGMWIWSAAEFVPWLGMDRNVAPVAETWAIFHDDGNRYAARNELTFANGARRVWLEDYAEDGTEHQIKSDDGLLAGVSQSVLADGTRHDVFRVGKEISDETA